MPEIPLPSAPRPGPPASTPAPESPVPDSSSAPTSVDGTPQTGDLVVDAVLRDLAVVDEADLDGVLAAGESVHQTLTSRLSDLGS